MENDKGLDEALERIKNGENRRWSNDDGEIDMPQIQIGDSITEKYLFGVLPLDGVVYSTIGTVKAAFRTNGVVSAKWYVLKKNKLVVGAYSPEIATDHPDYNKMVQLLEASGN